MRNCRPKFFYEVFNWKHSLFRGLLDLKTVGLVPCIGIMKHQFFWNVKSELIHLSSHFHFKCTFNDTFDFFSTKSWLKNCCWHIIRLKTFPFFSHQTLSFRILPKMQTKKFFPNFVSFHNYKHFSSINKPIRNFISLGLRNLKRNKSVANIRILTTRDTKKVFEQWFTLILKFVFVFLGNGRLTFSSQGLNQTLSTCSKWWHKKRSIPFFLRWYPVTAKSDNKTVPSR